MKAEETLTFTPSEIRALRAIVSETPMFRENDAPGTVWPELLSCWAKLNRPDLRPSHPEDRMEEDWFTKDIEAWLEENS